MWPRPGGRGGRCATHQPLATASAGLCRHGRGGFARSTTRPAYPAGRPRRRTPHRRRRNPPAAGDGGGFCLRRRAERGRGRTCGQALPRAGMENPPLQSTFGTPG
jgi:hypothetical protein